jgi:hypothetical protein
MAKERTRTAKEVIDQAITENRVNEYLLYGFAIVFVLSGVTALICGMIWEAGVVALAGGIGSSLFFPAMYLAHKIRRENIAIRLLEAPLSKAETSDEAANALREFFIAALVRKPVDR